MRFELLEPRRLMARDVSVPELDSFHFSSAELSPSTIQDLQAREMEFSARNAWYRPFQNNRVRFDDSGILVAERVPSDTNNHTLYVAEVGNSACFGADGRYMLPNRHHSISFDIRHPESASAWLAEHRWAIVMQLWGPREDHEVKRNPPLSIYTISRDGETFWRISTRADSRPISSSRDYEDEITVTIPFDNGKLGEWQHWDVEYVPNPLGGGLARAWLDGELVLDAVEIKTGFNSVLASAPSGPLNPGFGLYAPLVGDKMEVHFDNMRLDCNGAFDRSVAGHIDGAVGPITVSARDVLSNQTTVTAASSAGIYSLNLPAGIYQLTVSDSQGRRVGTRLDLHEASLIRDLDLTNSSPTGSLTPPELGQPAFNSAATPLAFRFDLPRAIALFAEPVSATEVTNPFEELNSFLGDFNGDGRDDVVYRHRSGGWYVATGGDKTDSMADLWVAPQLGAHYQEVLVADFSGDGRDDIAILSERDEWWLLHSLGDRFQVESLDGWYFPKPHREVHMGDVDADGTTELLVLHDDYTWSVSHYDAATTYTRAWDRWNQADWTDVHVADFNGDGRDDLAAVDGATGALWVAESTGTGSRRTKWSRWDAGHWQQIRAADVNGDGLSDLLARTADNRWWALESSGDSFVSSLWSVWSADEEWLDVRVIDINADGMDDILARAASTNRLWATLSDSGSGRRNRNLSQQWGPIFEPDIDWAKLRVGDFNGDGRLDILTIMPDAATRRHPVHYSVIFG